MSERKRVPISAKLGMAAGALFITGTASIGFTAYKDISGSDNPENKIASLGIVATMAGATLTGAALAQADLERLDRQHYGRRSQIIRPVHHHPRPSHDNLV